MSVELAAYLAVAAFAVLGVFQVALAAGARWGRAAWGGRNPGRLPTPLRIASAVSAAVYVLASVIVLDRAGRPVIELPETVSYWGTWALVVLLLIGAVMNFASSSPYERFGWAPFALITALFCLIVATAPSAG